jgi:pimeloyl-ACP methyl ester carboxylesterase
MRTELITIATDTTPLDGAFHLPDDGRAAHGVLLMHGNTMNFYVGPPRFLPPVLTTLGFACLAFNRRGHDILAIRDSFAAEGGAFQSTQDGIDDNRHAARWMAERGFPSPAVIGHSYGGILGVRHACDHPATPGLVLLSAYRGGSDTFLTQHKRGFLAGDRLEETLAAAKAMIAAGRGRDLIAVPAWPYAISAESYVDRSATLPDIVALAPAVPCPVLFVRGDREPTPAIPVDAFAAAAGHGCNAAVVPDCDHFYVGREDAVGRIVADWLTRTLADGRPG